MTINPWLLDSNLPGFITITQYDCMRNRPATAQQTKCYHCGEICPDQSLALEDKYFCCTGCKTVYEILEANDLCTYYDLEKTPGISLRNKKSDGHLAFLDNRDIAAKLIEFREGEISKVTFHLPQIHCASCIWLLENLYKLEPSITESLVNFPKREIYLTFLHDELSLRQLAELLDKLGYAPQIQLDDLNRKRRKKQDRSFFFKLGIAGFAFGNIMLLSFPEYLGLNAEIEGQYARLFGWLNLLFSLPVVLYSASDYYRSAWVGLRHGNLNIDVPISLGILALFGRSAFEIISQSGAGYMDSMVALVFLLLVGKWFQNKTYDTLSFERDFQSYFPVAATRLKDGVESPVALTELKPGDTLIIRNEELIPADARLLSDQASIDYSFVSGEADPVYKKAGDPLYAGGRQQGGAIRISLVSEVSQSYLTRLWNHDTFRSDVKAGLSTAVDRVSRWFTLAILLIGTAAAIWWWPRGTYEAINVFTAVLIVACPCALALTIPFTLGNALRLMGRAGAYLKHTRVIEAMAGLNRIVFDKTGTLTHRGLEGLIFEGSLPEEERMMVAALTAQSNHPLSRSISQSIGSHPRTQLSNFEELPGKGLQGQVGKHQLQIGSETFTGAKNGQSDQNGSSVWVKIDGQVRGRFRMPGTYRKGLQDLIDRLKGRYRLSMISGDNDSEQNRLQKYFPEGTDLLFNQSPHDKLAYIEALQSDGEQVMMVGDGLNDAGALRKSEVGVSISENVNAFTPACDLIFDAGRFEDLDRLLKYSRQCMRLVRGGFVISFLYNVVGLTIAVQGLLSPLVAAILMPLSSITVVAYGVGATRLAWWRLGLPELKNKKDVR